jgi:hypothetical protein
MRPMPSAAGRERRPYAEAVSHQIIPLSLASQRDGVIVEMVTDGRNGAREKVVAANRAPLDWLQFAPGQHQRWALALSRHFLMSSPRCFSWRRAEYRAERIRRNDRAWRPPVRGITQLVKSWLPTVTAARSVCRVVYGRLAIAHTFASAEEFLASSNWARLDMGR